MREADCTMFSRIGVLYLVTRVVGSVNVDN